MSTKILDLKKYTNFLDKCPLTLEEITDTLRKYNLWFIGVKLDEVEHKMSLPYFVTPFYQYIYINDKIPTQEELYNTYIKHDYFKDHKFSDEIMVAIKARLLRTYPSLVRDIHFATFIKEKITDMDVFYSIKLDVNEGIDLLLVKDEKYFGVNLYTKTQRSVDFRSKKANRHASFSNVEYIELPVDFNGSDQCGKFFLYGEREYNQLMELTK